MEKEKLENISSKIATSYNDANKKNRSLFVKIKSNKQDLKQLAHTLSKNVFENDLAPIYLLQGELKGKYKITYKKFKKPAILRIYPDGETATETGHIFPIDRPIILLITGFDSLENEDQRFFAMLAGNVDVNLKNYNYGAATYDQRLHEGSIVIAEIMGDVNTLDSSAKNIGMYIDV